MYEKPDERFTKNTVRPTHRGFLDDHAVRRRQNEHDNADFIRSNFIRDIEKIMHCPYYPRYADKTQVLSFFKNDDITRRSLHVQYVSRIARTIGKALGLNLELIEAIALGHDIGHTPFGHAGESVLREISSEYTGQKFYHNVHSVRVLDKIFPLNLSLQTLDGILCHDGELELDEYKPSPLSSFDEFDERVENCYRQAGYTKTLIPCTLEGCVVRLSDIIAYLGKDRKDASIVQLAEPKDFTPLSIGEHNAEIIHNLTVNVIKESFDKPYIKLDERHFDGLKKAKEENYKVIYQSETASRFLSEHLTPMMHDLFGKLKDDLKNNRTSSPIFTHHIDVINAQHYKRNVPYGKDETPEQTVIDYIASMTDDYFIDLYETLFPKSKHKIVYHGYFG